MTDTHNIKLPNCTFKSSMLNPDLYIGVYTGKTISTDEWIHMQEEALKILKSDWSLMLGRDAKRLLIEIINGVVPAGLRITKPDPITNLR